MLSKGKLNEMNARCEEFVDQDDCPAHISLESDDLLGAPCPLCNDLPNALKHIEELQARSKRVAERIKAKCEQYWNEPIETPETHAVLKYIHAEIDSLKE